jgi:hypothetical protein
VLGVQVHRQLLLSGGEEGRASVASSNSPRRGGVVEPRVIDLRWRCFFLLSSPLFYFQCCNRCSEMLQSVFANVA